MGLFGSKKPQVTSVTVKLMRSPTVQAQGLNGDKDVKLTPVEKGGMDVSGAFQYFVMTALWDLLGYGKNGVVLTLQNIKDNALTIWAQAFPVEGQAQADTLYKAWVDVYAVEGGFSFSPPSAQAYGAHTWNEQQGVSPEDDRNVVLFESLVHKGFLYLVIGEARRPVLRSGLARNMQPFMKHSLRI